MKKSTLVSLCSLTALFCACQLFGRAFAETPSNSEASDPHVLGTRRQITQVGPRSGEGYFSPDGQQMIFQSERFPGNPFYQIYTLNFRSGHIERLSPGPGKTTCSWFHPSMKKALFSSTHLDPDLAKKVKEEEDLRKSPQKNKYSWSFDDQFDIFEVDLKTKALKRLTKEKGYDAEASYSPDGKWIAFASNRSGYTEQLNADDKKLFEQDPSSQMEIYLMKSDGSDVKRLTKSLGYDGGPFFSADGKKITWRRFSPNGVQAEIWEMNADGSEQKQLTHLGMMSWAPFFHPSGDYLIFTTNKLGFSNFELFIVDAKGEKDPVRVSYIEGFDGLPVFSPDGQHLSWTHKDEKGESQIYLADWDDARARQLLGLPAVLPKASQFLGAYSPADAKSIVGYLASERFGGRPTGGPEETKMMQEMSDVLQGWGLKTRIESFEFSSGVSLGKNNELVLKDKNQNEKFLEIEKDFMPLSFSKAGKLAEANLAFAGYGMKAPANDKQPAYDSYKDLDVSGKWVLIFREIPEQISNERRIFLSQVSRLHHKALVAKQAGALGLLIVSGPNSSQNNKVMRLRFDGSFAEAGLPVISISNEVAEQILKPTGTSLKSWQDLLDKGEIKGAAEIPGLKLQASVDLIEQKATGHNLIASLPQVKGAQKTLVIGAHLDHLGRGEAGSSLAGSLEQKQIHFGADDNASGVAALMLIAQDFAKKMKQGKFHSKQNIEFAAWTGEEIGLLGSTAFLQKDSSKYSAYLNMDMVGRLRESLLVQGAGSAQEWHGYLESLGIQTEFPLSVQDDPYLPSDSMAFYLKGIPGLMFFTGPHAEYHTPRDTSDLINYPGLVRVAQLVGKLTENLAGQNSKLTYVKAASSHQPLRERSFRVYLGTIPDYTAEKIKGVKISGTSKDSPAEKAGLLAGDVIREVSGTKIENIYDYVYVLQGLKANQAIHMLIDRQGKNLDLEVTPTLKD